MHVSGRVVTDNYSPVNTGNRPNLLTARKIDLNNAETSGPIVWLIQGRHICK